MARRSFSPAYPTSCGRHPHARASSRATHCVFASRLRTLSSTCCPEPEAVKPRSSSTTKSSGSARRIPQDSGAPCARGGFSAAVRLGVDKQHGRLGRQAFRPAEETQLLGRGGFHVHAVFAHL